MEPERRSTQRTTPEQVSYIRFEPEGGGIVLNASEEGLAFHAAAPVGQSEILRVCVSPNPEQRIELAAEIAWMDNARKCGGLRLISVPEEARTQIRQWLSRGSESPTRQMDFGPQETISEPAPMFSLPSRSHARIQAWPAATAPQVAPIPTAFAARSVPRTIGANPSALFPEMRLPERHDAYSHPHWLRGLATVFLVFVFACMPFLFLQSFRSDFANALIRVGEKLKGGTENQTDSAAPAASAQAATANPQDVASPPPPEPKTDSTRAATQATIPLDRVATPEKPEKINQAEGKVAEHEAAAQPRKEIHDWAGRSTVVGDLWSKVEAGDSRAEVALARLYLRGDSVPRNCEQARVLLMAAMKKGNAEAQQEYRKLRLSGCRR